MVDTERLHGALTDFAHVLVRNYTVGDVLDRLTMRVLDVLEVDGSGVTLYKGGQGQFVTASDDVTERIEMEQDRHREGPCFDAMQQRRLRPVADLTKTTDWPNYRPFTLKQGMRSVIGVPMGVRDEIVGALNVYAADPRDWSSEDLAAAQLMADMASSYIINAQEILSAKTLARQLQHALDSRILIEQAKGMLAQRMKTSPNEAFRRLREYSRSHQLKIHDVARAIVEGHTGALGGDHVRSVTAGDS